MFSDHPDHVDACKALAYALHRFLNGASKKDVLGGKADWAFSMRSAKVNVITGGSFLMQEREDISSTGDAADTLEAIFWTLWHSDSFRQGALQCVNLGGEAVTLGAVFGQLAGSLYGEIEIPIEWIVQTYEFQGFYDFAARLMK
jgi:ADP-ribosylglycohydrolase